MDLQYSFKKVVYQDCTVRVYIFTMPSTTALVHHCVAAKIEPGGTYFWWMTNPLCQCSGFIGINEEAEFLDTVLMLV